MRRALVFVSGAVVCLAGCSGEPANRGEVSVVIETISAQQITRVNVAVAPANVSQDLTYDAATGQFTGTLVVPEGKQTLTASAYAATTLIGWISAVVTVVAHNTATVQLTILDTTNPPPNPDRSPIITAFAVPRTTVENGETMALAAAAVDLDGDPVVFSWTSAPTGCGTFADASSASTSWTAAATGTCHVAVTATARGKTDSRGVDITVLTPVGSIAIGGSYVARPQVVAVALDGSPGECLIARTAVDATCRAFFQGGATYPLSFEWERQAQAIIPSVVDTCGGNAVPTDTGVDGDRGYARFQWTPRSDRMGACAITATASAASLSDSLSIGVLVTGPAAAISKARGDGQTAVAGTPPAIAPTVFVADSAGNPVAGTAVQFSVVAGGGSAAQASVTTGTDGLASTAWTLGPTTGPNQLEATAAGLPKVVFSATAVSGPADVVAAISKSEIVTTLTALTGLGERTTWSGQQRALSYLEARLSELAVPFASLDFQWNGATWTDLEITFPGTTAPTEIYMAGAHYDAYPAASPGADDDGSGTAGVVELARVLSSTQLKRTVRLALFFNEESGGTPGSVAYAAMIKARGDDLRGFINLDMIAYRPPDQDFDVVTRPASAALAFAVADAGNRWVGTPVAKAIVDESCG